jgi:hypothetical protein
MNIKFGPGYCLFADLLESMSEAGVVFDVSSGVGSDEPLSQQCLGLPIGGLLFNLRDRRRRTSGDPNREHR